MKRYTNYIFIVFIGLCSLLGSCISNDIPYPIEVLVIDEIVGKGFTMDAPDYKNREITLQLEETTDIRNVKITSVKCSENTTLSKPLVGTFDMRTPIDVTLSLYQDYGWTIIAEQNISRIFKVENQIGSEVIDIDNFTIHAYVSSKTDLGNIKIKELKLGPDSITEMSPSIEELTDFRSFKYVYINYHGEEERWRLYVDTTDVLVAFNKCDVWVSTAWLSASGETSGEFGFRYRISGNEEWTDIPSEDITNDGGSFSTELSGLTPDTDYDFIAYSGENLSPIESKHSEIAIPLENGGFENWYKAPKPWHPYAEGGIQYWGTGNTGATTLGDAYNLTTPSSEIKRPGTKGQYAAQLQSLNVLVKFAAGNIFVGRYLKTAGTNGIIGIGQPFNVRPIALRGWVKYDCGTIDIVGTIPAGVEIVKDKTKDNGAIYIALGTWTPEEYGVSSRETEMLGTKETPIIIDTRDNATFFNPNSKDVIAYGELIMTETVGEWMEFTIPLDYNSTSIVPTHLVIVCSASRYGDYFTGSTESQMWLDDFELVY